MGVEIGPLRDEDLGSADRICRVAFGTFLGMPDPTKAFGDRDFIRSRRRAPNTSTLAARKDGILVGSNVVSRWGSLGWFGPLTVTPQLWDQGIARALLDETDSIMDRWGVTHRGLFTFGHSPKHVSLYQRYGYWPRFLTPILEKSLVPHTTEKASSTVGRQFSLLSDREADEALREARELTGSLLAGLDLTGEIRSVQHQRLGETILSYGDSRLVGLGICHIGIGSEAGTGAGYVKFAAVAPDAQSGRHLRELLGAIEEKASSVGASRIEAGVNLSHPEAYRILRNHGFRTTFIGVAMQSPNEPGYHRDDLLVVDDWR